MKKLICPRLVLAAWVVLLALSQSTAQPSNTDTNSHELLRGYVELQEQLHATQMHIEALRKQADDSAERTSAALNDNARVLESRLKSIETSLSQQRSAELDALRSSNRTTLLVVGSLAVLGFSALVVTAFFQWRTVNRLTEVATAAGGSWRALPNAADTKVLGLGDSSGSEAVQASHRNLMLAFEVLEKRLVGLEERTRLAIESPVTGEAITGGNGVTGKHEPSSGPAPDTADFFLAQGVRHLEEDDPQQAVESFDEALRLDPSHGDAFIRKGAALEKLGRTDDAIACYDLAIAKNASATIAYLHKGGLLNRMQRFNEALECYEKALQGQGSET